MRKGQLKIVQPQCSTRNLVTKIKFPFLGRCFRPISRFGKSRHTKLPHRGRSEVHNPSAFFVDLPLGSAQT